MFKHEYVGPFLASMFLHSKCAKKPLHLATLCDADVKHTGKQYTPGRLHHMIKVPVCD